MSEKNRDDVDLGDLSRVDVTTGAAPRRREAPAGATEPFPAVAFPWADWRGSRSRLAVLGAAGVLLLVIVWLLVRQQQLAASLAVLEARAQESVQMLETRVNSAATSLKSNDSETQRSLNVLAADIGRVDGAVRRLSRQVELQGKDVAANGAALSALATELRTLAETSAQARGQLEVRLETRLKAVASLLEQQAARQKTLGDAVNRLERTGDLAQLRSEVAVLGATLREEQEEHARRLRAAEQAIGSNDAFRRQVNATIDRLVQQVGDLSPRR